MLANIKANIDDQIFLIFFDNLVVTLNLCSAGLYTII